MATVPEERGLELFHLLVDLGDLTVPEILLETGWKDRQVVYGVVQKLRDMLAERNDTITVTAEPQGFKMPWLYGLRGGGAFCDPDAPSPWMKNRLADTDRRIKTVASVLSVAVEATDGRTLIGRKARVYQLHIKRALEEVELLAEPIEP